MAKLTTQGKIGDISYQLSGNPDTIVAILNFIKNLHHMASGVNFVNNEQTKEHNNIDIYG